MTAVLGRSHLKVKHWRYGAGEKSITGLKFFLGKLWEQDPRSAGKFIETGKVQERCRPMAHSRLRNSNTTESLVINEQAYGSQRKR
jgi:hypothetical protein